MAITLRPVTLDDASMLLRWKNEYWTRKAAIVTHDRIKNKDHIKWLTKRLKKRNYWIIEKNRVPVGSLRYEPDEIIINIDRRYRKQGIASLVLNKLKQPISVKIVDENIPSMRFFIKHGFLPYKRKKGYYIYVRT